MAIITKDSFEFTRRMKDGEPISAWGLTRIRFKRVFWHFYVVRRVEILPLERIGVPHRLEDLKDGKTEKWALFWRPQWTVENRVTMLAKDYERIEG